MSEVSPHLGVESWITGVCSPYVISLSDFAYYVFGKEPAVAVHLALWFVCLSAISMMFVKILLAVCMLVVLWSERKRTLCLL